MNDAEKGIKHFTLYIVILTAVCLICLGLIVEAGSDTGDSWSPWFSQTDPDNRYTVTVRKHEPDSPLALGADTDIRVTITDAQTNSKVQEFYTDVRSAGEKNWSLRFDKQGITLSFVKNTGKVQEEYCFPYDTLSDVGKNVRGGE